MKPEEFSFAAHGVTEGMKLDVVFKGTGYHPPACRSKVENVYSCFALVKTRYYRVTIHYTDLLTGTASVQPAQGLDPFQKVIWLPSVIEKAELEGRQPRKRAAGR